MFNNIVNNDIADDIEKDQEEHVHDKDSSSSDSGLNRSFSSVSNSASTIDEEE
jgi:hypothetical protein